MRFRSSPSSAFASVEGYSATRGRAQPVCDSLSNVAIDPVLFHVGQFAFQPESGTRRVRAEHSARGLQGAVKEHLLDPVVVEKILNIDGGRDGACSVCVQ